MLVVTDFGHDPDDAIALSYLIEHGHIPQVICVTPGFDTQIKIISGFCKSYRISPVVLKCSGKEEKQYNPGKHSVFQADAMAEIAHELPYFTDCLIIGPALNMGDKIKCNSLFFQGGYSPDSIIPLSKFSGVEAVQSFNPCGAKKDFNLLLDSDIPSKYYIGKNVCHGYTKQELKREWSPENKLVRQFFDRLSDDKAMHDVLAAKCMIDIEIGLWQQAMPVWHGNKLSTIPTDKHIFTLIGLK